MMKTKRILTMLTAMLLTSVCTFAQNNNTPLKGDVNEDGTVDVADLVAVMQIMKDAGGAVGEKMCYWYAGVNGGTAVTEANFTDVASKIAESQIPETGFVTATDQYVYFVMPESRFMYSLTDASGNAVGYDCTDAYGYHIYKTQEKYSGKLNYATAERIYYWYIGLTDPSTMTEISPITDNETFDWQGSPAYKPGWRMIGTTLPKYTSSNMLWNGNTDDIVFENRDYYYIAIPSIEIQIWNGLGMSEMESYSSPTTKEIGGVTYIIYKSNYKARGFGFLLL